MSRSVFGMVGDHGRSWRARYVISFLGASLLAAGSPVGASPTATGAAETPALRPVPTPTPSTPAATSRVAPAKPVPGDTQLLSRGVVLAFALGAEARAAPQYYGFHAAPVLTIGYRIGRVVVGLGFHFTGALYRTLDNAGEYDRKVFVASIEPTVQVDVFRVGALALYVAAGLSVGYAWYSADEEATEDEGDAEPLVGFFAGAGVRYFLHRRFAVGAELGFRGSWKVYRFGPDDGVLRISGAATIQTIW